MLTKTYGVKPVLTKLDITRDTRACPAVNYERPARARQWVVGEGPESLALAGATG